MNSIQSVYSTDPVSHAHPLPAKPNSSYGTGSGNDLDLRNIFRVIAAHLPALLFTAGLVLAAGLLLSMAIKPKYESTAVIDVADSTAAAIQSVAQQIDPAAGGKDAALLQSQRMIILVLQELNDGKQPTAKDIEKFQKRLAVTQEPGTALIQINYKDESAERAAQIVNLMIEQFKKFKRAYLNQLITREKRHIDLELEKQRTDLQGAENRVDEFKVANGLTDNLGITLKVRQISTLNSQLLLAQVDAQKADSRRRQMAALQRSGNTAAIGALSDSPLVQRLREQEADLRNRIRELQNEYGPKHPVMIDARSQLAEVRRSIGSEIKYVSSQVRNEAALENERVETLEQSIAKLETEVAEAQSSVVKLRELEREADSSKRVYEGFLNHAKDLSTTSEDLILSKLVTVISQGYESSKAIFPRPSQIMLLALVGASVLGLMAVFLAEHLNPKVTRRPIPAREIQSPEAVTPTPAMNQFAPLPQEIPIQAKDFPPVETLMPESEPKIPTVNSHLRVPIPGDGEGIVPAHEVQMKPYSKFAAAMKSVNELLGAKLNTIPSPHAVLITANRAAGDKLSIAAALATLNASENRKVVIVDLTRGETAVHRAFGLQPVPGISEVMETSVALFSAIQTDYSTHVSVFANGKPMAQAMTQKLIDDVPSLIALLKKYFDLVLVVARNLDIATSTELPHKDISQTLLVISQPLSSSPDVSDTVVNDSKLARHAGKLLPIMVERS